MHLLFLIWNLWAGPERYFQSVSVALQSKTSKVIFGSPDIGYFETTKLTREAGTARVTLIPPVYRNAIDFYEKGAGLTCVKRQKFSNPTPKDLLLKSVILRSALDAPFYLTNGYTPFEPFDEAKPKGHSVVFVLNRWGEIVWSYLPDKLPPSADHRTRTVLAKRLSQEQIGLLHSYDRSFFERIDGYGKSLQSIDPAPTVLHHDFLMQSENELMTLSNSLHSIRKPWFFWRKPMNFLGSPLIFLDLKNFGRKTVWDYIDTHNPFNEKDWTWNEVDSTPLQNNFTHANSIDQNEDGFLLSFRNLNKILFINRKDFKLAWTSGPSSSNTFPTRGSPAEFYRQHHATFLEDKTILVFDNGQKTSRLENLVFKKKGQPPELLHEYVPSPSVHSTRHGSGFEGENGNIFGFFPNTAPGSSEPNRIIEFDRNSGKEIARLEFNFGYSAASYRAEPFSTLFEARPFKGTVPPCLLR